MSKAVRYVWFLLVVAFNVTQAQKTYRFESITVDDGLSQSSIASMVQDVSGHLWIATQDGLNKYDGYSFKVYRNKPGDSTSLQKNYVTKVILDKNNTIWVATLGTLSRYNPTTDNFTNFPISLAGFAVAANVYVWDVSESRDGSLVLCTTGGLFHFDPQTKKFRVNKEFSPMFNQTAYNYYETRSNGDWAFFNHFALYRLPGQTEWRRREQWGFRSYYDKKEDEIYFYSFNKPEESPKAVVQKLSKSGNWQVWRDFGTLVHTLEICFAANGTVWMATDNGVFILDKQGKVLSMISPFEVSASSLISARSIYQTRDEVVWIGTNGFGLKKYNPQTNQFSYLGSSTLSSMHLSHPYVDAIYTSNDLTVYVGTPAGIDIFNVYKKTSQHLNTPARIVKIFNDDKDQIWFSSLGDLWLLKNNTLVQAHVEDNNSVHLFPSGRRAFYAEGRISVLENGEKYFLIDKPMEFGVTSLNIIGDSLWVGIAPGPTAIKVFNLKTKKHTLDFLSVTGYSRQGISGEVKCILKDSKKRIWIGSTSGLSLYHPNEKVFDHFSEKDGLPNNTVYGILEDEEHNLWLSTNRGLCEFNPETKKTRNFEIVDGLQSNEFNTGAYFKSTSGTLYFGGVNGVTYFNPRDISTKNTPPRSVISGYYVNNKLLDDYSKYVSTKDNKTILTLQYDEHDFGFDFVGVGFSLPGRTRYKYMLENYDPAWHDIGNLRHINFTNISPGHYVFNVKASDPHGNWELVGASVVVVIDAPLWKKSWVWGVSGLLVAGLSIAFNNFRIRNLKKRAQQLSKTVSERTTEIQKQNEEIAFQNAELLSQAAMLEEKNIALERAKGLLEIEVKYFHQRHLLKSSIQTQEEERKRISQDLHDELGAVLSIARMHLVQLLERQASGINDLKPGLEEARKLTEAALVTMRRISHELMPPLLEKFGLIKTIKALVTQINETRQIVVDFETEDESLRLPVTVELGLYRVCMELINNTIKHAHATEIKIQLKKEDDFITFLYCDNGRGLPAAHAMGRGFNNIETRINIMGGSFSIDQESKKGFHAKVAIPIGVAIDL
jgi:signal transduction histidine kinase/ligand-binding sensor domain-containing protein